MTNETSTQTDTAAIAAACRLTKLDTLGGKTSATRGAVDECDILPFCPGLARGNPVWKVYFDGGSLVLKSGMPGYQDRYRDQRKFIVLLDESMSKVLSIRSEFKGATGDMRPEPCIALPENGESYTGPPDVEPKLTFIDAVDAVLSKGIGSPYLAKEIYGSYVMYSKPGSDARPVWVITLRGLPPIPSYGRPPGAPEPPAWMRNRRRNVVDAMTGEVLFATNTPLPDDG
ncbi:MAG: hypothetical protein HRF43_08465 [Phycisphaerae bacterium]